MIRRVAGLGVLLAFSLWGTASVQAQTASDYAQGVTVSGSTATIFFNPTSTTTSWTDVHYAVNGGALQNLRMARDASTGKETQQVLQAVSVGNTIAYSFTYNKGAPAYDTPTYSYTVPAAGGGGGTVTPAAGQVCFFTDINYGGTSMCTSASSTWVGSAWNDVISSVKVSAGTQVVLYGDINYAGGTLTLTADTPSLVPQGFNDVTSSYKISAVATGGTWNKQTTFNIVNGTHNAYDNAHVFWAIIGKDWTTGKFVYVNTAGQLIPMSTADNGALTKNGVTYTNYFHTIAQAGSVTIPPINSARLMLSVGGPMFIRVNQDINGNIGYAGANIENPSDPNIDVTFDFMEMAIVPDTGFFGNTTRVDQFGFPVTLRLQGLGGFDQTVGETATRASLFSAWAAAVPAQFQGLAQTPYSPYRIIAPAHASFNVGQANANYLDAYIQGLWTKYASQTLTFTDQQGTFTGHVVGGKFQFTDGQGTYTIQRAPTTAEALLGSGVLNDATGQTPGTAGYDKQLQIQAQLCAAINRHIVEDPAHWYTPSFFYATPSNSYSKFWHDHSLNGLSYGFAYDDVGGFSSSLHTAAPTIATVTVGW
ncbi:MAG: beta-1,3-glucanase family protein [Pseudomonadota bacterium]|nr:beta-1,3-glucanase family protein [Pseudomonadota bacterium]